MTVCTSNSLTGSGYFYDLGGTTKDNGDDESWKALVLGHGKQLCPYSTAVLGNPQKRHTILFSSRDHQNHTTNANVNAKATANTNDAAPKNLDTEEWSPARQALLRSLQTCFLPNSTTKEDSKKTTTRMTIDSWRRQILSLDVLVCPSKFEVLGDDKNLVLPSGALLEKDLLPWLLKSNNEEPLLTTKQGSDFMTELWKQLAMVYHPCPRILRKGGVHPDSHIRQTGYQLLWPHTTTTTALASTVLHKGQAEETRTMALLPPPPQSSPGWITVTEQGIRQSFDVTEVMFSRGNITEKIRFGTCLVQDGDVVLDLYAGIGYYTLPALVKGKAAHVYACEWNPKALQALQYNLEDNKVNDQATVIAGPSEEVVSRKEVEFGLGIPCIGGAKTIRVVEPMRVMENGEDKFKM